MKKSKTWKRVRRYWGEYWIEVAAVFAVILGFGLIRFEKVSLNSGIDILISWYHSVVNFLLQFDLSDVLGTTAILVGILLVLWRIRYHLYRSEHWRVRLCPRCGGTLHRIHRTLFDRLIGIIFLPHSRRFRCDNPDCRWSGLRYGRHHTSSVGEGLGESVD